MEQEGIVAAKKCPHFITQAFIEESGQADKCRGCQKKPLIIRQRHGNQNTFTLNSPTGGRGYLRRRQG